MQEASHPVFTVDHVSRTVSDLDAALSFYCGVLGARELFRMGPLDAAQMPVDANGRDWMETHVGVAGACLTLAMLEFPGGARFQLVEYDRPSPATTTPPRNCDLGGHHLALRVTDVPAAVAYLVAHGCIAMEPIAIDAGPLAGKTNQYVVDPFGQQLEIVD